MTVGPRTPTALLFAVKLFGASLNAVAGCSVDAMSLELRRFEEPHAPRLEAATRFLLQGRLVELRFRATDLVSDVSSRSLCLADVAPSAKVADGIRLVDCEQTVLSTLLALAALPATQLATAPAASAPMSPCLPTPASAQAPPSAAVRQSQFLCASPLFPDSAPSPPSVAGGSPALQSPAVPAAALRSPAQPDTAQLLRALSEAHSPSQSPVSAARPGDFVAPAALLRVVETPVADFVAPLVETGSRKRKRSLDEPSSAGSPRVVIAETPVADLVPAAVLSIAAGASSCAGSATASRARTAVVAESPLLVRPLRFDACSQSGGSGSDGSGGSGSGSGSPAAKRLRVCSVQEAWLELNGASGLRTGRDSLPGPLRLSDADKDGTL